MDRDLRGQKTGSDIPKNATPAAGTDQVFSHGVEVSSGTPPLGYGQSGTGIQGKDDANRNAPVNPY